MSRAPSGLTVTGLPVRALASNHARQTRIRTSGLASGARATRSGLDNPRIPRIGTFTRFLLNGWCSDMGKKSGPSFRGVRSRLAEFRQDQAPQ